MQVYTIGYGQDNLDQFVARLRRSDITHVIDTRTNAYSNYQPDFRQNLKGDLAKFGIKYAFMGEHLGAKPKDPRLYNLAGDLDAEALRNTPGYRKSLRIIGEQASRHRLALMCGCLRPVPCHRGRIISPDLLAQGVEVLHIDGDGEVKAHHEALAALTGGQAAFEF